MLVSVSWGARQSAFDDDLLRLPCCSPARACSPCSPGQRPCLAPRRLMRRAGICSFRLRSSRTADSSTAKRVLYYMQGPASTMYFTERMAAISMSNGDRGAALHMRFIGANPRARLVAHDRARRQGQLHLGLGASHEPAHVRVGHLPQPVAGIDMTFRANGTKLKYQFLVRPGAEPSAIRLAYVGGGAPAITQSGGAERPDRRAGRSRTRGRTATSSAGGRECPFGAASSCATAVRTGSRSSGTTPSAARDRPRPRPTRPSSAGRSSEETFGIDVDLSRERLRRRDYAFRSDFPTTPGALPDDALGPRTFS